MHRARPLNPTRQMHFFGIAHHKARKTVHFFVISRRLHTDFTTQSVLHDRFSFHTHPPCRRLRRRTARFAHRFGRWGGRHSAPHALFRGRLPLCRRRRPRGFHRHLQRFGRGLRQRGHHQHSFGHAARDCHHNRGGGRCRGGHLSQQLRAGRHLRRRAHPHGVSNSSAPIPTKTDNSCPSN